MGGISSANEIFLLLPNQSLSIEHEQLLCVSNTKIWLIIHFIITGSIETFLVMQIVFPLQVIMILYFNCYWERISNVIQSNWLNVYDLDIYSLMIIVLKKELKLIFVYIYFTFLYTWLQLVNSNYTVTYFNFLRWLIEASLVPRILITTLVPCYFVGIDIGEFFEQYHLSYVPIIIIKIPLFVLMRFAESQSNFLLNEVEIFFFKKLCDLSLKLHIY